MRVRADDEASFRAASDPHDAAVTTAPASAASGITVQPPALSAWSMGGTEPVIHTCSRASWPTQMKISVKLTHNQLRSGPDGASRELGAAGAASRKMKCAVASAAASSTAHVASGT